VGGKFYKIINNLKIVYEIFLGTTTTPIERWNSATDSGEAWGLFDLSVNLKKNYNY